MEKYLKMSDVFWGAKPEDFHINPVCIHENFDDGVTPHNHVIHAINTHDELVAMNKELLVALESIENDDGKIPDFMWNMIKSAIAKAKGTA